MKYLSTQFKTTLSILIITLFLTTPVFAKMGSINGDKVQLGSGPGTNHAVKWEYGDGFPLKIISQKGNWLQVKDFENDSGWVYKDYINSKPHMIVKVNKGKKRKINLRSGPGRNYKVIGKAYYGVVFETVEQKKGWAKIRHESGLTAWIKRSLLWGF